MAQKETAGRSESMAASASAKSQEFAEMGRKRIEDFVNAQTELLGHLQEANREWMERMQSEASLASDFAAKLTSARTMPDAVSACQEFGSRRLEMMTEDSRHLLSDARKFMEAGTRMWSGAWLPNGPRAGT
jgi:uncharacterized damage-inducible protein DinB